MRYVLLAAATVAGIAGSTAARAVPGYSISGSVGGAPSGVTLENFDSLTPAIGGGGTTPSGIVVTSSPDAGVVEGGSSGLYAPPYLSGGNGSGFGPGGTDQADGPDATPYLAAGSTSTYPGASVTLSLPGTERYLGLLWGSVDNYNMLSLYNGATLVGTITGSDVIASPNGDQGVNGTVYVNITALDGAHAFDKVVMTSSQYTFEMDNVAFNPSPVPEPASLAVLGSAIVGLGFIRRRRAYAGRRSA